MNRNYSFLKFLKLMISISILSFPLSIFANKISLHDQPKPDAKVVGEIDLSTGIIPIYKPKEGGWVKIADPENGNVGWVKSSDIDNANTSQSIFTLTQRIDNKSPTTYQIIQFGQPSKLTPAQTQSLVKKMQSERQEMHKSIQNMMRNMDQLFYNNWYFMHHDPFPFFVPVVMVNSIPTEKNVGNKTKK